MTLKDLKIGESAVIAAVGGEGALRQHFLDMGVIPGAGVTLTKFAPMGDPIELTIHGYELTLRIKDAEKIEVIKNTEVKNAPDTKPSFLHKNDTHPILGDNEKFHVKSCSTPKTAAQKITFALAGNQNCGKTTLFNQLTGSNQHTGNFPGVTVDRKSGTVRGYPDTEVTDLPGIYSLSPYTNEEIVSRQFILDEKPHGIINIVDATNIERNLYLTMQLMELDIPIVLALNMMDELCGNGADIHIKEMEDALGIPVIPISASKNEGVDKLIERAYHVAKYNECPVRTDFYDKDKHGSAVACCINSLMHIIRDRAQSAGIPVRFAASKLIEGDSPLTEELNLTQNELDTVEHIIRQMEDERGLDRSAAIADMRFSFIKKLCDSTVLKPVENKEHKRSLRIDKILTGKFTAIPAFIIIMSLIFYLTFNVVGAQLQDMLETLIEKFTAMADNVLTFFNINPFLRSLVTDAILSGVGSVLSFVPIIIVLFFFLSMFEDSGYMARVAFVADKPLRKIGLSGRSIVPMLIGFGCTVPGVMASRTLPSERDRKMTIMLTPFMSCTAKLPIYGFFAEAFFSDYSGLIMTGLYVFGILSGVLFACLSKEIFFKGEAVPFVMELPNYRLPGAKNVFRLLLDKAKDFLQRAFTVIFLASVLVWFLQTFDFKLNLVSDAKDSILAHIAGFISPVFSPLGFGDWRIVTALIAGFIAKENVVSTLSVLLGSATSPVSVISPLSAAALLVFCLLYTPCIAAVAAIKRELGGKWATAIVLGQCIVAWIFALIVRAVIILFI